MLASPEGTPGASLVGSSWIGRATSSATMAPWISFQADSTRSSGWITRPASMVAAGHDADRDRPLIARIAPMVAVADLA